MQQRTLKNSDLSVSVFGLGTMTFGAESDESVSHRILDRYVEEGGRFVDTADVYSHGVAEEIIGRWIKQRGGTGDVLIATKARFPMSDDPADRGAGRNYLDRALEASLRRLNVDVIDLYQMHAWDPSTPLDHRSHLAEGGDAREAQRIRCSGQGTRRWSIQLHRLAAAESCAHRPQ